MFFNYVCENCFNDEHSICYDCAKKTNLCLNCVSYGNLSEPLCGNCHDIGDEGYSSEYDLIKLFEWIEFNDSYWLDYYIVRE